MTHHLSAQPIMWRQLWPAAREMGLRHHLERGFSRESYCVDHVEMQSLELANRLTLVGGYADGQLVGYWIWYLGPQFGAMHILLARSGPLYIESEWRRSRLMKMMWEQSEQILRFKGASRLLVNTLPMACGSWLRRRGARPYENSYLMELSQ